VITSPGAKASTASAASERNTPALKFRAEYVDIRDSDGRRVNVVNRACALHLLATGPYEAVGQGTVKYLRRIRRPTEKAVYSWSGDRKGDHFSEAETLPGRVRS